MKKFSIAIVVIGILIFLNVFFGFALNFWKLVEFIVASVLILQSFIPKKRWFNSVVMNGKHLNFDSMSDYEKEEVSESLKDAKEEIENEEMPEFAKKIATKVMGAVEDGVIKRERKISPKKVVKNIVFGLTAGFILLFDSLNMFDLNFNFWQIILIFIGAFLLSEGISSLIPGGEINER